MEGRQRPWGAVVKVVAGIAAVGTIATLAVVTQGYDAQEVPRLETSVWVARADGQYGRVNTDLAELDIVRAVADPSGIVQSGADGVIFAQGFGQAWAIDPAAPVDLGATDGADTDGSDVGVATPSGTRHVETAGGRILYVTTTGEVLLARFSADGEVQSPAQLDPFAEVEVVDGDEPPRYTADAAALDATGRVVMYSTAEHAVRSYDAATGRFTGDPVAVPAPPADDVPLELVLAGDRWVLSSAADGLLWIEGITAPIETGLGADAVLQSGASDDARVLLADAQTLVGVATADGAVETLAEASGNPAAPVVVQGVGYAAWVSTTTATLWSSESAELRPLTIDGDRLDDARTIEPAFQSNGDRAVLVESTTGMIWTLPDGRLVPVDEWTPLDDSSDESGKVDVDDIIEQQPPVAEPDAFGVRRGAVVTLPVIYNDHDPNKKDVLTVDPESVTAMSEPGFAQLSLVADDQQIVARVSASSGSASFEYAVTDGVAVSAPVRVTLTVVDEKTNSAPVWCGVEACLQQWPTPQVSPGGFVSIPTLTGWVDPEGDTVSLSGARADDPSAPVTVVPTSDGRVVVRHHDPNAADAVIPITVTVSDAFGATTTAPLELRVTSSPALTVSPVAIAAGVGEKRQLSIGDSVVGGSGSYRLVDAVAVSGAGLTVSPSSANGTIELSADSPGSFLASYTVQDTVTLARQTAVLRYMVAASARPLAIPPLTAFVRPGEDATVDVLAAAENTSGRVLMVSEVSSPDPRLSASVVGEAFVRVSGSTADGLPGRVGVAEVRIADGTGATTTTQLTVFLLAPSYGVGPIAVPDAVAVRAGAQADIRVLDNDVSPRGERARLHPQLEVSGTAGELAFVAGDVVRYLAPDVPGVYTLRYSSYLENDPQRLDSAEVTVNVLGPGSNRAPQPPVLSARVLAGQRVSIPVPMSGLDPDGDEVVLADVAQPGEGYGVASINAMGTAVVYRAPVAGVPGGQVTFSYTVRDANGQEATGEVRVGVLSGELSDVAPVTYSDYVAALHGSTAPLTVHPLSNDRDPKQGTLTLLGVVPNAPAGSEEYTRLAALIDPEATSLDEGVVVLRPGDVAGTHSFVYTVQSDSTFSTAEGLIVMGVSDTPAPDHPVVADTIVTARTRAQLSSGIDVVSGRVQWPTGDVSALTLSLWGDTPGFAVDGWQISGAAPASGAVVPFVLTGADPQGTEVQTFGFLRVPAFDDMRVQLRAGLEPTEVGEELTAEVSVGELLDIDPSDAVEVRGDDELAVQRANASCTTTGGDGIAYDTGREAPWTDTCSVEVRLAGQSRWSVVAVPFAILPKDPLAILNPMSRTVSPGETQTIDLLDEIVTWEGGRVGDTSVLDFAVAYEGESFVLTQTGRTLTVEARADAHPGARETAQVSVSSYGGLRSTITLVVGIAAPDAPRGATFGSSCDVSKGTCLITVVGIDGEYDPFAGKPGAGLTITAVGSTGAVVCAVATVTRSSDTQLAASWPSGDKPVGGECVVGFTVQDAQGRTGQGQVTIDVLGYPQTPRTVSTVSYTGTSVTVRIPLGDAAQAHPPVTGVVLYEGETPVPANCTRALNSFSCQVTGLVNGARHEYIARAVNSVGESGPTSVLPTWAYQAPVARHLTARPVFVPELTNRDNGAVEFTVESDADTQSFRVNDDITVPRQSAVTTATVQLPVGRQTLRITPISAFTPPPMAEVSATSEGSTVFTEVVVAGSPAYTAKGAATSGADGDRITLSGATFDPNSSSQPLVQVWAAWEDGAAVDCRATDGVVEVVGTPHTVTVVTDTGTAPNTGTVAGLNPNTRYRVAVCGSAGFGAVMSAPQPVVTWAQNTPPPGGDLSYRISTTRDDSQPANVDSFLQVASPAPIAGDGFFLQYKRDDGQWKETFALGPSNAAHTYRVRRCLLLDASYCSDSALITAAEGSAPNAVTFTFPTLGACLVDGEFTEVQDPAGVAPIELDTTTKPGYVIYRVEWGVDSPYRHLVVEPREYEICVPEPEPETGDPDDGTDDGSDGESGDDSDDADDPDDDAPAPEDP